MKWYSYRMMIDPEVEESEDLAKLKAVKVEVSKAEVYKVLYERVYILDFETFAIWYNAGSGIWSLYDINPDGYVFVDAGSELINLRPVYEGHISLNNNQEMMREWFNEFKRR